MSLESQTDEVLAQLQQCLQKVKAYLKETGDIRRFNSLVISVCDGGLEPFYYSASSVGEGSKILVKGDLRALLNTSELAMADMGADAFKKNRKKINEKKLERIRSLEALLEEARANLDEC